MGSSEEEIKLKVVYPLLRQIGFEDDELEFERSFPLRLGLYTYKVDTMKQVASAHPRLDILVKRDGKNLFVIEVKTDAKTLTDDDRDQAVSYARLVHPMAPVAIVTNGLQSKVYEIVDKNEIKAEKALILKQTIQADMNDRYEEAFRFFMGYSPENVQAFCQAQVREGMKTLWGSKEEPFKKFIPALYIPPRKLIQNFIAFLDDQRPVFAIIGDSGSGKTCAMCGLALELAEKKYPVLFYRATELPEGIMKSIADDFNWEFSHQYDEVALFRRLGRLFEKVHIDLMVLIDGLDEWEHANKLAILGNFASKIKGKGFRLIVSCKSNTWENLLMANGIPTSFAEEVFATSDNNKGYFIEPFDDERIHLLVKKYREFYGWDGHFESMVLEECKRLPFLLRIFFEVGSKHNYRLLNFSIKEFYDKYFETVLERISESDREQAKVIILRLAKLQFEKNSEEICLEDLLSELGLPLSGEIPPSLYSTNILEKTVSQFGCHVSFYFRKFRDYVIAFGVSGWNELSVSKFQQNYRGQSLEGVQYDAMRFFYEHADIEKKRVIDETLRRKASEYLEFYIEIVNKHFPHLKYRFPPYTLGDIGFVADVDIKRQLLRGYSFRSIVEGEERIKFIPFEKGFWNLKGSDSRAFQYFMNASGMHFYGSADGFRNINIKAEVLKHEIKTELDRIIDHGELNERNNYFLCLEKTLGIVVRRQSNFHGIHDKRKLHKYLPLSIDKIEYGRLYRQAEYYFQGKRTKDKIKSGIIKPTWLGTGYGHAETRTDEDFEYYHTNAHEAAMRGEELEANEYNINLEADALRECLPIIKKTKGEINETIIPDQEVIVSSGQLIDFFTDETLSAFAVRINKIFLEEYRTLIETNFPTLKNEFFLYSRMPVRFFIVVGKGKRDYLNIYECSAPAGESNIVTLCQDSEIVCDLAKRSVSHKGETFSLFNRHYTALSSIMNPRWKFTKLDIDWDFVVARHMVYSKIKAELPSVMNKLLAEYGVASP